MENLTLQQLTKLIKTGSEEYISRKQLMFRKAGATALFVAMDTMVLIISMVISLYLKDAVFPGNVHFGDYISICLIALPLFPIVFYFKGLYPGYGIDAIEELKMMTYSASIVYVVLAMMSLFVQDTLYYSRLAFLLSWLLSIVTLPLGRALVRKIFGKASWWGVPVVVIGAGKAGEKIIKKLKKQLHIGLRPILAVDDDIDRWGYVHGVPVIGGLEVLPEIVRKTSVDHSIIAMPKVPGARQQEIISNYSKYFQHTTVIPDIFGLSSLWVSPKDIGGIFGLEVQQKLLGRAAQFQKRLFDILLASILIVFSFPFTLLLSTLIWFDSKGKVFFKQVRMGLGDSRFKMIKFRTMHVDAEKRLHDLLNKNPKMKAEYEIYHKLKNDPRLTRVGKFLRKFSLDEIPQFWNVIKGEMSLIGPRAYMPWEKYKMKGHDEIILKVKPGISGLWQVTDRNESSFEERNLTDVYYIRNWSVFLDFYILARTISVVLTGRNSW